MKVDSPATMGTIAAAAGVSASTVSRALRNHPRLSVETRVRIQELAAQLGYCMNPVVSGLMTQLRMTRVTRGQGRIYEETLAWVDHLGSGGRARDRTMSQVFEGAESQARSLGYRLEEMDFREIPARRVAQILHTRRVRGVIVGPFGPPEFVLNLPWEVSVVVAGGRSLPGIPLHRADFGGYDNGALCVARLRALGYRRIGWAGPRFLGEINAYCYSAAFLNDQDFARPIDRVPRLLYGPADAGRQQFVKWFQRYRPEAIVCAMASCAEGWLRDLGLTVPRDVALAAVNVHGEPEPVRWAGIDQRNSVVGSNAVQIAVTQLQHNRMGLPASANRMYTVAKGEWLDGPSAPQATELRNDCTASA